MTDTHTINECYICKNRRSIPGNVHISCSKPDPKMKGHGHGIANGWFIYPQNFDPSWKLIKCGNFDQVAR